MTEVEDAVVAEGDPVGVSAEVLEDTLDAIERGLAIDNPFFTIELAPESFKVPGRLEVANTVGEYETIRLEAFLKEVKELPLEQRREDPDRDEETFSA